MLRFKECISWCDELGIDYITSWLLSRENLMRSEAELEQYFKVLNELFEELVIDDIVDNYKIQFIIKLNTFFRSSYIHLFGNIIP